MAISDISGCVGYVRCVIGNYTINKYKTSLDLTIEKAIDMMMLDNHKNKIEYENISKKPLKVDLELFALAIKNS